MKNRMCTYRVEQYWYRLSLQNPSCFDSLLDQSSLFSRYKRIINSSWPHWL